MAEPVTCNPSWSCILWRWNFSDILSTGEKPQPKIMKEKDGYFDCVIWAHFNPLFGKWKLIRKDNHYIPGKRCLLRFGRKQQPFLLNYWVFHKKIYGSVPLVYNETIGKKWRMKMFAKRQEAQKFLSHSGPSPTIFIGMFALFKGYLMCYASWSELDA